LKCWRASKRRRTDDGDLLARHGHDEGGPQGHLGLAEADVAADQAIHRRALAQILQHVADGVELVVGLFVGEAGAELVEQPLRRGDGVRDPQRALGGQGDEPLGHFAQPRLRLRLASLPGGAAQTVQLDVFGIRAVARQKVNVLNR
jgi:hypothetical protein